jgi:hypothetical protein
LPRRHRQDLSGLHHSCTEQSRLPLQHPQLAEQPSLPVHLNQPLTIEVARNDAHATAQHDKDLADTLAYSVKNVAHLRGSSFTPALEHVQLIGAQTRKCLMTVRGFLRRALWPVKGHGLTVGPLSFLPSRVFVRLIDCDSSRGRVA